MKGPYYDQGAPVNSEGYSLKCEQCGEADQSTQLAEAGLCDDCFASTISETLAPILGYAPCCFPCWLSDDVPALCLEPSGTEHTHS